MSASREETLRAYFSKSNKTQLEPILTNLNGDNSWMISFPVPPAQRSGKAYYHVISDAWLQGSAVTINSWLVSIGLAAPAAITDGNEVDAVVKEIEDAAAEAGVFDGRKSEGSATLDAIFSNFHYPDHLSEATLRTCAPNIPVFASKEAGEIVRSWGHFDNVIIQQDLEAGNGNWKNLYPGAPLPEWLSVFRLVGHHELNFATAMIWSSGSDLSTHQALLYSPHGIRLEQPTLQTFSRKATPPVKVKAILHGLHDSFAFGWRTTLGVAGGLALEEETKAKYWVQSHDMMLDYKGFIMRLFVSEIARTLESGIAEMMGKKGKSDTAEEPRKPNLVTVENGRCFVLE